MDIISSTKPTARKEHKCDYCDGKIIIGEKYDRMLIKGDTLYPWKSHLRCLDIASKLDMYDRCNEGVTSEDFYEIIQDEFLELNPDIEESIKFSEQLDFVCNHFNIK